MEVDLNGNGLIDADEWWTTNAGSAVSFGGNDYLVYASPTDGTLLIDMDITRVNFL